MKVLGRRILEWSGVERGCRGVKEMSGSGVEMMGGLFTMGNIAATVGM